MCVPTAELLLLICDDGLSGRLKEGQYGDLDAIFILVVGTQIDLDKLRLRFNVFNKSLAPLCDFFVFKVDEICVTALVFEYLMHRITKRDEVLQGLDIIVIELIAGNPILHVAFSSLDHFDFVDHKIYTLLQLSLFVVGFFK